MKDSRECSGEYSGEYGGEYGSPPITPMHVSGPHRRSMIQERRTASGERHDRYEW